MAVAGIRFSANLGFLFRDMSLREAVRASRHAGFDAVEMHWPLDQDPRLVAEVLDECDLPLLSINTARGNVSIGEFGLCALPGRGAEARESIDEAVAWARQAGARNIHVMAGKAAGEVAFQQFVENLRYAADVAGPHGIGLLVEPMNRRDAPGYLFRDCASALRAVEASEGAAHIMFDCYHLQIEQGDLIETYRKHRDFIGHVQLASVPDRAEPDHGEIDYGWLISELKAAGYDGYFGAEYRPTSNSLSWMNEMRGAKD